MRWMIGFCAAALVAALFALGFGGCAVVQGTNATNAAARLQQAMVEGCAVVQPTLIAVAAIDPAVTVAATANGLVCAAATTVTVSSAQTLVTTGIPAIEQAVTASQLIPANQKPIVVAALGVFQLTISNALMDLQMATPASGASS